MNPGPTVMNPCITLVKLGKQWAGEATRYHIIRADTVPTGGMLIIELVRLPQL